MAGWSVMRSQCFFPEGTQNSCIRNGRTFISNRRSYGMCCLLHVESHRGILYKSSWKGNFNYLLDVDRQGWAEESFSRRPFKCHMTWMYWVWRGARRAASSFVKTWNTEESLHGRSTNWKCWSPTANRRQRWWREYVYWCQRFPTSEKSNERSCWLHAKFWYLKILI